MTKWQLFSAMVSGLVVTVNGFRGAIRGIAIEDGSGHCYNVTVYHPVNGTKTVFVRTID